MNFLEHNTLYLVDISSFIFRAYHAVRPLNTADGLPVSVPFGVMNMLLKLLKQAKKICIVKDSPEESFRRKIYPSYKLNRLKPTEDLKLQIQMTFELLECFCFPSLAKPTFEADDLIAACTKIWLQKDPQHTVMIISSDKDLLQLVSPRVHQWDTLSNKTYDPQKVFEKYGVHPSQMADYLALVGDASDNIPGVDGVGAKTAALFLQQYETLEQLYYALEQKDAALDKRSHLVLTGKQQAFLSQSLTMLDENALEQHFWSTLDAHALSQTLEYTLQLTPQAETLLKKWGFQSILGKLTSNTPKQEMNGQFITIQEKDAFLEILKKIEKHQNFSFDLETTSLDPQKAKIVGFSICIEASEAYYIPLQHTEGKQLDYQWVFDHFKPYLESAKYKKIGQNLKFDWKILLAHNIHPQGLYADTMIASYLLNEGTPHNLEFLAKHYLDYNCLTYEQVCGPKNNQITFDAVSIDLATRYAAEDAWIALKLWEVFEPLLEEKNLLNLFKKFDLPLVEVLAHMEHTGIMVDNQALHTLSSDFQLKIDQVLEKIHQYTQGKININSPKQLAKFLYEDLKLIPKGKKRKSFHSTDSQALERLQNDHPIAELLLNYRELTKLQNTYVQPLIQLQNKKTLRIYTTFHQTVTATGRLSSSDPNLQNIPIRSDQRSQIRKAFITKPSFELISADYSQIELRILAHMSEDTELIAAFHHDQDIHTQTAAQLFKVTENHVTETQRRIAKAINFGLIYGKTAFGLANELNISRTEAQMIIESYFQHYSGVKTFLDKQVQEALEKGFCQSLFGRNRKIFLSRSVMEKSSMQRVAMNTPIQSTAADIIKLAMIEVYHFLRTDYPQAALLLQVHDELLVECPQTMTNTLKTAIKNIMEKVVQLKVPLKVNVSSGPNWLDL